MRANNMLFLGLVLSIGCGGSPSTSPTDPDPPVVSVRRLARRPLVVGGAQQLSASTGGQGRITWQSSNPGVASVGASGLVHGISAGTATITATVEYTGGATATGATSVAVRQPPLGGTGARQRHRRH